MAAEWELRVVGESNLVRRDGTRSNLSSKPKRFAVLLFLALGPPGRRVRRDVLLATFWPELDALRARNSLRVSLHQLRQALGADVILGSGEDELSLDANLIRVDFNELAAALDRGDVSAWIARPSLELVPGLHVPDAAPFEQWLDNQRQTLNSAIARSAWALADASARAGNLSQAIVAAHAATRLDRSDESGARRLISLLDQKGDRAGALAEFESFERWLSVEFEATPSPETLALVDRVRTRTKASMAPEPSSAKPVAPVAESLRPDVGAVPAATSAPATSGRVPWLPIGIAAAAVLALAGSAALGPRAFARLPNGDARAPVAIVPFQSELTDSAVGYFAPALGESIADELPPHAVISYAASRTAASSGAESVVERLRGFGARALVFGKLSGTRDSLVLSVAITRGDGGDTLDSATFRGSERELLFLRDSVVAAILRATGVSRRQVNARHVPVPEAYQLSLNADWLLGRRSRAELLRSRDLYTQALELDPEWAELWLGLARVTGSLAYRHYIDFRTGLLASEHAADEALARAPDDGRALIERSLARFQLGDRMGAEADAKRASALDTSDAHMQSLIGTWWQWDGDHLDSALFYTRRAQRLAPWDRQTQINILQIVACRPDSEATIREAEKVLDLDPHEPEALETLAWTLTRFGRWDEATQRYVDRYAAELPRDLAERTRGLQGEARFRATVRLIRGKVYSDQHENSPPAPPLLESRIALFEDLGMRDSSLATLAGVVDSLDAHHANMMCLPNFRSFRHDPRTLAIVRERGWTPAEFGREQ